MKTIEKRLEVEMLSPLMADFIPDNRDIVDLDDAEPLEGEDLIQYEVSIAEKIDEVNRLGTSDNHPCNLMDYFHGSDSVKKKVERITMAVKEQDGILYGCASLILRKQLTPEEYVEMEHYLCGQYSDGWGKAWNSEKSK